MPDPLRFLLDQNFPEVSLLDPRQVDRSVEYVHIRGWRPDLVADTPDWLIYFEAELARSTGMVTRDWHQTVQVEEAFALTQTRLTIVSWREPSEDPIVEWAMLIAYMPEVKKILAGHRVPPVIFLPSPHLDGRHTQKRDEALGVAAKTRGISRQQATREAKTSILDYLDQEGQRQELVDLAERRSTRWAPGSTLPSGKKKAKKSKGIPPAELPT